jgi:hypothetical protein
MLRYTNQTTRILSLGRRLVSRFRNNKETTGDAVGYIDIELEQKQTKTSCVAKMHRIKAMSVHVRHAMQKFSNELGWKK